MLILPQKVEVLLNSMNIKYFESLGYEIPKYKDKWGRMKVKRGTKMIVNVLDLQEGTHVEVNVLCDYCLEEGIRTEIIKSYQHYVEQNINSIIHKDCCKNHQIKKKEESNLLIYGVTNPLSLLEPKIKRQNTLLKRYGVPHYSQTEEFKIKSKRTFLENWGTESPLKNKEVRDRIKLTCNKKYGGNSPTCNKDVFDKIRQTNLERYGHENPMQNPEILAKAQATFYKNHTCKTSSQQLDIFNQLEDLNYNIELNFPVSRTSLDIAIFIDDNIKIDLEYDAWYWHQDPQRDRKRDEYLKSNECGNWKILRIKSGHLLPTLDKLQETINYLVTEDKPFAQIVLEDWKNPNRLPMVQ